MKDLLEVIADTAGDLEDQAAAMTGGLDALRPYLPVPSQSGSEPAKTVEA